MTFIKYDPFRELQGLQEEVNRLFMTSLPRDYSQDEMGSGGWTPKVDIFESENEIVLEAELPGINRKDFELSIENNVITLKGERHLEKKAEGDNYHRVERSYGTFTRSFTLPRKVSAEETSADFKNGILRVSLPKKEDAKSRKIEVVADDDAEVKTIEATTSTD